jgi:hypothetical protein
VAWLDGRRRAAGALADALRAEDVVGAAARRRGAAAAARAPARARAGGARGGAAALEVRGSAALPP